MGESVSSPILCPTLVGRAGYLSNLQLLIEQVKEGEGHVTLISGEAGIGKSRLVAEAKTSAMEQGFLLLQGNCFPTDRVCPYAPVLDLLRSLIVSNPAVVPTVTVESLARDLFPLLPELAPDQIPRSSPLEPEQEKRRLFAVLAMFFLHLSSRSPVLLVIEDIHWSDDTSLDFLHYLARRSQSHALFLLLTYRPDELHPSLINWLTLLNRERRAHEVQLPLLSRPDVDMMLSAIFDERRTALDMRRFLHGELLDTLYTLTEGNPFFVEETISSLIAAGDIFSVQGYWNRRASHEISIPRSIQDAVQRRIAGVGEAARSVLTLAAVAGRHFDFALLQQLTQYDERHLLLLMNELVAAQLVVEETADQFAFRHALTRQTIYAQLLTRERRILHRAIAEMLEQQFSLSLDAHLEDLAYHFYQAKAWQKVLDYAQRAGEKALRLYSHHVAIDYFTWALEAVDHLEQPPIPTFYLARGQAYETFGEFEQAQQNYTQALDAARRTTDRVAEWQSMVNLGFLWTGRDYALTEIWFRQALALAQDLGVPVLQAHSLNRIGNWHLNAEQPHEALRYHREALTLFEQLHDAPGIAETLDLLGMASYLGGDLIRGTTFYQQAIALFQMLGDKSGLTSSLATLTLRGPTYQTDALISAASLAEVCQDAQYALEIARETRYRAAEAYALMQLGLCLGSQGEYGHALATTQQSLDIAEEIEHRQWQVAAHVALGGIYRGLFAYVQARKHLERALTLASEIGSLFWTRIATGYLASVMIDLHDFTQAEDLLDGTLDPNILLHTMAQRLIWCAAVELALALNHPMRALEITEQLLLTDKHGGNQGQGSLRVLKLRGEALAALHQSVEAQDVFEAARKLASAQGVRPVEWRVCLALGKLYQVEGNSVEAEQVLTTARMLINELAATLTDEALREHFQVQAARLFPDPPSPLLPGRSVRQAYGGLTRRECEVALLVAQGKSNQAIADALVVTKRTIETHIGNIMFKLGCSSRTQIAVWAVETALAGHLETKSPL